MFFKSISIILFTLFFITGCSLQPGSYNDAIRFSENPSSDFTTKWNDQVLEDQYVGYETGTNHPYYILFYTTDFKDIDMRNMVAKVDVSVDGGSLANLQDVSLVRAPNNKEWVGTFYLPASIAATSHSAVKFHLNDALGEYKKCTGIFFKRCSWESVSLSANGYDNTSADTYSNPFKIKEVPAIESSGCATKTKVLFLEHGESLANTNCTLKTKIVGYNSDYDLYLQVDDGNISATDFNITENGVTIAGPYDVNMTLYGNDANSKRWFVAHNILSTTDGTTARDTAQLNQINTIRAQAHKKLSFILSSGASTNLSTAMSDAFAIRPHHFALYDVSGVNPYPQSGYIFNAGDDFNVSIKALNANSEVVQNYDNTLNRADFSTTANLSANGRTACSAPSVDAEETHFTNGSAILSRLSFNDIADEAMSVAFHAIDTRWTEVDKNGDCIANSSATTPDTNGMVGCNIDFAPAYSISNIKPVSFSFLPMFGTYANGQPIFIADAKDSPFTYLDDTMDKSLDINFTLRAVSSQGAVLSNFDTGCLANDVNLTVPYVYPSTGDYANLNFIYNYAFRNLDGSWGSAIVKENSSNEQKVKIYMPSTAFHNGELSIGGHLNFTRSKRVALNPFLLTFKNAIIDDSSDNIHVNYFNLYGFDTNNSPFKYLFLYGASQVNVEQNSSDIDNKKIFVDYNFYCDRACENNSTLKTIVASYFGLTSASELTRHKNSLWWINNPKHQVFETYNGITKFKHGGVATINGHTLDFTASKSNPTTYAKEADIIIKAYHDNNTTVIDATYDGLKGYPFQKSVDIAVSPWLEHNRFGVTNIAHRVDLRFMQVTKDYNETNSAGGVGLKVKKQNNRRVHW